MATITQVGSLHALRDIRDQWLRDNRGVLAAIATRLGVSHGAVRSVYHGATRKSTTGEIEVELSKAGAPGFTESDTRKLARKVQS
jgi:hypothetical protein